MDSKGFLWILTLHGISRFDGLTFKNYTRASHPAMLSNQPNDMVLDKDDNIWLSYKTNLQRLNTKTDQFTEIQWKAKPLEIHKMAIDTNSNTLYAVNYSGYYRMNAKDLTIRYDSFLQKETRASEGIGEVFLDSKQNLWVPYWRFGYHHIQANNAKQYMRKVDIWPLSFSEDRQGYIYCNAWQTPFYKIWFKDNQPFEIENIYPTKGYYTNIIYHSSVAPSLTGDSIIWMSFGNEGIGLFNKNTNTFLKPIEVNDEYKSGLPENAINYFYNDKFGNFWLCSWRGLIKVNPQEQQFKSRELKMLDFRYYNLISGFVDDPTDKNILWMSIHGAGIFKLNKNDNSIIEKYFFESTYRGVDEDINYDRRWLHDMILASDNTIWSPTYGGLVKVKQQKVSFIDLRWRGAICFNNQIVQMRKNEYFIASNLGLFSFNDLTNAHQLVSPDTNRVFIVQCVAKVNDSLVAAGTEEGILLYNTTTKIVKHKLLQLPACKTEDLNKCRSITSDGKTIYFGTAAGLVAMTISDESYELIGAKEGIDNVYVNSLLLDSTDNLWIYTFHHLYSYNPKDKRIFSYDKKDGIHFLTNDGNVLFAYNKKFYIGFRKSFTEFDPLSLNQSNRINTPIVDQVKVNKIKVLNNGFGLSDNPLELKYNQNEIEFTVTACDYTFSDKVMFKVQLEGYEKEWRTLGTNRSISYNNLNPGTYTFKVKSSNSAGVWNNKATAYTIKIVPAFWQTWWFKLLLFLFLAGIAFWIFSARLQQLKKINSAKEEVQELTLNQYKKQIELEQIVNYFSASLIDKNNVDEIMQSISNDLMSKLEFEDCMIYLWNTDHTILEQKSGYGIKGTIDHLPHREKYNILPGQGIIGRASVENKPILINDTTLDKEYRIVDGINRLSELCVPISIGDKQIGMLNVEASSKYFFTEWHVKILETIATLLAEKINAVEATTALQKQELELAQASRKIAEAELSMLRSQMNPHFIFNSLHSIHNYIWENKPEDASEYLVKFSKLIRRILEQSSETSIPLSEEIETLKLYVELEHRRTNSKFSYAIDASKANQINDIQVPPMLFQPFVENAIWHGLNNMDTQEGKLSISFATNNKMLIAIIEDNGIGRAKAKEMQLEKSIKKKSMGLEITQSRIANIAGIADEAVQIIDLPQGTKIIISLPI